MTTMSAFFDAITACSLVDMPKPSASGILMYFLTLFRYLVRVGLSAVLSPVVPVRETQYTKPVAVFAIFLSLLSGVIGEITWIAWRLYFLHNCR